MNIITLDFETYYSQTFSLSKITTEEYIRSLRFETIGVSVKVDDAPAVWFSGTTEQTKRFLDKFNWSDAVAVAHNAMFDMAILSWVYDIRPKRIADTLSMARALGAGSVSLASLVKQYDLGVKGDEVVNALGMRRLDFDEAALRRYAAYCKNDTELTYKLFQTLGAGFPVSELRLIDLTIRMFSEPVLDLDQAALVAHLSLVRHRKEDLLKSVVTSQEVLMSNPKFAEALKGLGVDPPTKISPTTGKETLAFGKTDEDFKALLEHEDPAVQALVAARLGVKSTLEETRTERFIGIAKRGKLPIPLRYYAAHTGRWGGDDKVNMQNLPRKSPLKDAVLAPKGYRLIDSDSSQIEARTLAWLAGQNDLVEAFDKGKDVYKIMAPKIYNKAEADITKDERFVGKTTILGCGYGMGAAKFKKQLKTFGVEISEEEAQSIIETYRTSYPTIPKLWKKAGRILETIIDNQTEEFGRDDLLTVEGTKGILLPNGLYLRYPNLRISKDEDGKPEYVYDTKKGKATVPNRIYGGKVIENVCQALARIIIGEQMLKVAKKYKVAMTVHDAIGCVVPEGEAGMGQEFIELCMRIRPTWAPDLPLNCEAGAGKSYGEC
jgi:DNA polymerase